MLVRFIEYFSTEDARRAIRDLDGRLLGGKPVTVSGSQEVQALLPTFLANMNEFLYSIIHEVVVPVLDHQSGVRNPPIAGHLLNTPITLSLPIRINLTPTSITTRSRRPHLTIIAIPLYHTIIHNNSLQGITQALRCPRPPNV